MSVDRLSLFAVVADVQRHSPQSIQKYLVARRSILQVETHVFHVYAFDGLSFVILLSSWMSSNDFCAAVCVRSQHVAY